MRKVWSLHPSHYLSASRLHIVAGKGGVGKTAVSAMLATAAGLLGSSVLLIEVSERTSVAPLLGIDRHQMATGRVEAAPVGGRSGAIDVLTISPERALSDYLNRSGRGIVAERLHDSETLGVVTRGLPGLGDIIVLGLIKKMVAEHPADLVVVDGPASGHALSFLRSPLALEGIAAGGVIADQAGQVRSLLEDRHLCQVSLVTIAEETPVAETIDTAYQLEEDLGIHLGPVVVNMMEVPLDLGPTPLRVPADFADPTILIDLDRLRRDVKAAASLRNDRARRHRVHADRLAAALPLPQTRLPLMTRSGFGPEELTELAQHYLAGVPSLWDSRQERSAPPEERWSLGSAP